MPEPDQPHHGCTELVTGAPGKPGGVSQLATLKLIMVKYSLITWM